MATVSGIWRFKATLSHTKTTTWNVNFTSNGVNYTSLKHNVYLSTHQLFYGSTRVYTNGSWTNEAYRIVDFGTTPQTCTDDFINYLTANATQLYVNVNKVIYAGTVLIDLTSVTVTPETLAAGVTAYDATGALIVGTMVSTASISTASLEDITTEDNETIIAG